MYNMPLEIQIGQVLKGSYLVNQNDLVGLETALNFVRDKSVLVKANIDCSLLPGCPEKARKTILQLIMIKWGIFGLGSSTAGLFLANHFQALGPYFGNVEGHTWPSDPLAKAPASLESAFHQNMLRMTQLMSHGKLSGVSMLDLPAFGSKIARLRKHHRIEPNWPTEINFAIRNKSEKNIPEFFKNYKTTLTHWENFSNKVYRKGPLPTFTPEMNVNQFLNFTNHVRSDLLTFLIATHGSFKTASNETLPIWIEVANKLFDTKNISNDISEKGLYDKLIMQCGFRKDNTKLGCGSFPPTLTTNGMCYSFNSEITSNIWQTSNITRSFSSMFLDKKSEKRFHRQDDGMLLDIAI
jgi:hypothetical protein